MDNVVRRTKYYQNKSSRELADSHAGVIGNKGSLKDCRDTDGKEEAHLVNK